MKKLFTLLLFSVFFTPGVSAQCPVANFNHDFPNNPISFTNLSIDGVDYRWVFSVLEDVQLDTSAFELEFDLRRICTDCTLDVCLIVTSASSCTDTLCESIRTSSVKELLRTDAFHVFPNPSDGRVELKLDFNSFSTPVEVYDLSGKLVLSRQHAFLAGETKSLDLSMLEKGLYFIRIQTDQGSGISKIQVLK